MSLGKMVYFFGGRETEGNGRMKGLLGGKGAGLAEMARLLVPVPPGFTITTELCNHFYENMGALPEGLEEEVAASLRRLEGMTGKGFGDTDNPLLLSVRSGARASMPGMMDTILNLGLNRRTLKGLIEKTGDRRFPWDLYRRFVAMFGDVVLGLKPPEKGEDPFEMILRDLKREKGVKFDTELDAGDLQRLSDRFEEEIRKRKGIDFPDDPMDQLWKAIISVFRSWNNERAVVYRRINNIPDNWGTAVNIQAMVFGNRGNDSATGVLFTRDPSTGENNLYGEYLLNAQGEDVVAGIRTPCPLSKRYSTRPEYPPLEEVMPGIFQELLQVRERLESHFGDMQDIEFTVEEGKLYILQTRAGKRSGFAAVRIAADMVEEGKSTPERALMTIEPEGLNDLLRPVFRREDRERAVTEGWLIAKGLNAGPGGASGKVAFFAGDAFRMAEGGGDVILVRITTSPDDIKGMEVAKGILTSHGGMTSHAALVARQLGRVCVVGCSELEIDYEKRLFRAGERVVKEGDCISIDGTTGEVFGRGIETVPSDVVRVVIESSLSPKDSPIFYNFRKVMEWADSVRRLRVRANADKPDQARIAVLLGAEGIGLCRTEHMFFDEGRIDAVREMILAREREGRMRALEKIFPMQRDDFAAIFRVMEGRPVNIRLLDPPLHEFLPPGREELRELAARLEVPEELLAGINESLHEANPMLGHRGCRLGITYPEVYEMQVRAIMEAACLVKGEGIPVVPEMMIPLTGHEKELSFLRERVERAACDVLSEKGEGLEIPFTVGTMIELPRACIVAGRIAEYADFFSFGTNDLTQTTFGISRDDAGTFLQEYKEKGILKQDPFITIDRDGVGELMKMAKDRGRSVSPSLKIGICGEHGGEPASIEFCHETGLDYVSCSPFRVPIARLAAAIAVLKEREGLEAEV